MALRRTPALLLAAAGLAACQSAPARSIPDPLPETLEWALPPPEGTAFLGLVVRENDAGSTLENLSMDPGVRVHEVTDRSPAEAAGFRVDDVVLEFEGVELAVPEDLEALLQRATGGDRVTLDALRGDTAFTVEITLGGNSEATPPAAEEAYVLDPARSRGAWGTNEGAILVSRAEDGPLSKIEVGTRVVSLNGKPIVSGRGLVRRFLSLGPGARAELGVVTRGGDRERMVRVKLLDEGRRTTRFSVPVLATYDATPDRTRESFVLLDLYIISLLRFERDGTEKRWSILRFLQFENGVGELDG